MGQCSKTKKRSVHLKHRGQAGASSPAQTPLVKTRLETYPRFKGREIGVNLTDEELKSHSSINMDKGIDGEVETGAQSISYTHRNV